MAKWNSPQWASLLDGSGCPICLTGVPKDSIATLRVCHLTCGPVAPLRGTCCLVLKRHAVELHELGQEEASALMADVQRAGRAIWQATGAVGVNYEIHGNTIPHLHVHLYPRQVGDPFEDGPIDWRKVPRSPYGPGELERVIDRIRSALV